MSILLRVYSVAALLMFCDVMLQVIERLETENETLTPKQLTTMIDLLRKEERVLRERKERKLSEKIEEARRKVQVMEENSEQVEEMRDIALSLEEKTPVVEQTKEEIISESLLQSNQRLSDSNLGKQLEEMPLQQDADKPAEKDTQTDSSPPKKK